MVATLSEAMTTVKRLNITEISPKTKALVGQSTRKIRKGKALEAAWGGHEADQVSAYMLAWMHCDRMLKTICKQTYEQRPDCNAKLLQGMIKYEFA